ncbi:MAG: hypothetical protein ACC651_11930 [Candidatus Scalindua sp.]
MSDTLKQWNRVNRALTKIENNQNRNLDDYEDDIWSFFQNCWHLKDWVKNDDVINEIYRTSVENDVHEIESIKMCADLANRSKHLKLTFSRVDANVSSRDLHIHAAPPGQGGYGEYNFKITNSEGAVFDAIEVAKDSVKKWSELLTAYKVIK